MRRFDIKTAKPSRGRKNILSLCSAFFVNTVWNLDDKRSVFQTTQSAIAQLKSQLCFHRQHPSFECHGDILPCKIVKSLKSGTFLQLLQWHDEQQFRKTFIGK